MPPYTTIIANLEWLLNQLTLFVFFFLKTLFSHKLRIFLLLVFVDGTTQWALAGTFGEYRESPARVVYENLVERIPQGSAGGIYVQMAKTFWAEYLDRGNYERACFWSREAMASYEEDPAVLLGPDYYGSYGFDYSLEDLCPNPLMD